MVHDKLKIVFGDSLYSFLSLIQVHTLIIMAQVDLDAPMDKSMSIFL